MKVVILAGGYGTRIAEETDEKPKPMVLLGNKPIIWHIMKYYASFGHKEFIICCGYKGEIIKNYFLKNSSKEEDWNIECVDTGLKTMTGGRLKRVSSYIDQNETFLFTYGDGLSDINIDKLIEFHELNKVKATVTAVFPPSRFGALQINDFGQVTSFEEKPKNDSFMINGGFFVLHKDVINTIADDNTVWEKDPMEYLVKMNQLYAFKHRGFFLPMDTLRDKRQLESMWNQNCALWKIW